MAEKVVHAGGCFCGATRFAFSGSALRSVVCYCASCRKAVGATRVAWLTVKVRDLHFSGETPRLLQSSPGILRSFCAQCGTSLTWQEESAPETIDVTIASFDQPENFPPGAEVWTGHRLAWDDGNSKLFQDAEDSI